VLLALGAAALESTPNDWSAVALRDWLDAGRLKGAGPVVFAAAMLLGRFRGDRLVDRLGPVRLLATALSSIVAGTAVIVLSARTVPALAGFGLWGLGVSVMFPQVYLMAANADPSRPGAGLAAMTLAQRTGFMVTAATMGAVSARAGYATAFVAVVAGASVLWLGGLSLQRGRTHKEAVS
jgi:predicted MFS family arabinose efflux permease